jgi:hypothetical protein
MHTLTYNNDVTHLIGEKVTAPYLNRQGGATTKTWVVTDAVYDANTNKTKVEFDEVEV